MKKTQRPTSRLLLYRPDAGGVNEVVLAKLHRRLPDFQFVEYRHHDFRPALTPRATVVASTRGERGLRPRLMAADSCAAPAPRTATPHPRTAAAGVVRRRPPSVTRTAAEAASGVVTA